jgi:uncharacterized protein affecting Mg2+/Co2+ transport
LAQDDHGVQAIDNQPAKNLAAQHIKNALEKYVSSTLSHQLCADISNDSKPQYAQGPMIVGAQPAMHPSSAVASSARGVVQTRARTMFATGLGIARV